MDLEPGSGLAYSEIHLEQFWKYSREWLDASGTGMSEICNSCRHSSAGPQIYTYLTYRGQAIHDFAKKLNIKIRKINSTPESDYSQGLFGSILSGLRGVLYFTPSDSIEELEVVNYHLAPSPILEAVKETLNLHQTTYDLWLRIDNDLMRLSSLLAAKERDEYINCYRAEQKERSTRLGRRRDSGQIGLSLDSHLPGVLELTHVKIKEGFVYVLSNSWMKDIYKVGFTSRNPDERAKEVTREFGIPEPFKVERYWRTNDPYIVEQRIFEELANCRLNPSYEFFSMELQGIITAIEKHLMVD